MRLTEQQINHFRTFGFLVFRQLFTPEEWKTYCHEFDLGLDALIPGHKHDGRTRFQANLMDATTPFITSLNDDPRFWETAEQLLGKEVLGVGGDSNYYVGDTDWHPDNQWLRQDSVKFTIYLEPLNARNGALRVIPGSHREPLHSEIAGGSMRDYVDAPHDVGSNFGVRPDQVPCYVFDSEPGDVLAFHTGIWHGAFGGDTKRRMGTIQYYEDPQTEVSLQAVRSVLHGIDRREIEVHGRPWFPDYWRTLDNPRHQAWVRRMDEIAALDEPAGGLT